MNIEIDTGNAAFEGGARLPECARILREVADKLEQGNDPEELRLWPLFDVNGNRVGKVEGGTR